MTTVAVEEQVAAADRAELARAALARAEERTGTQRWVRPVRLTVTSGTPVEAVRTAVGDTSPLPDVTDAGHGRSVEPSRSVGDARSPDQVRPGQPGGAVRLLPVRADLAALLPSGALDRGTTVVVTGSTSLTLGLLADASRAGSWVALVGLPGLGVLAAQQLGLDLDRMVLVPDPGPDGPTVLAALLDGVDVVVVGPRVALTDGDRRRLSARARERSAVLVPTTPWPAAHVVLTARAARWEGLDRGHGHLRTCRLRVERTGRGTAAQRQESEVLVPVTPAPREADAARPRARVVRRTARRAG